MSKTLQDYNFALATGLDREVVLRIFADDFVNKGGNVVLFGETGTGKSHIADALIAKVQERGKTAYKLDGSTVKDTADLYEVQDFANIENGKYHPKRKLLQQLIECDLLVIDGLPTNFAIGDGRVTAEILRNRLKAGKSTFICSQGRPEDWVKRDLLGGYTAHVMAETHMGFYFDVSKSHPEFIDHINPPKDSYGVLRHQLGLCQITYLLDQLRNNDELTEQNITDLLDLYNIVEPVRDWHVLLIVGCNLTHKYSIPDRRDMWKERNNRRFPSILSQQE